MKKERGNGAVGGALGQAGFPFRGTVARQRGGGVLVVLVAEAPFALGGAGFDLRGELLAAGELGDGEGVEAVHGVLVGEHDLEEVVELAGEAVFAGAGDGRPGGAEQAFMGDSFQILGVRVDQVVERTVRFGNRGLKLVPACFDDFEEDVVL